MKISFYFKFVTFFLCLLVIFGFWYFAAIQKTKSSINFSSVNCSTMIKNLNDYPEISSLETAFGITSVDSFRMQTVYHVPMSEDATLGVKMLQILFKWHGFCVLLSQ
jgi:hypothetical protein